MANQETIDGMIAWMGLTDPSEQLTPIITIAADNAENTIRSIRQQADGDPIEPKYQGLAIEMGVYLYEKRGVDGVSSFSENGISRVYEKGTFPSSMLRRIAPVPCTAAVKPKPQG